MQGSSTQFTTVMSLYSVCAVCFQAANAFFLSWPSWRCVHALKLFLSLSAYCHTLAYACKQCQPLHLTPASVKTVLNMSSSVIKHSSPSSHTWILSKPSEYRKAVRQIQPLWWCRRLSRGLGGMMGARHRGPPQLPPAVEWTGTGSRLRTRLLCIRSFHPALPHLITPPLHC